MDTILEENISPIPLYDPEIQFTECVIFPTAEPTEPTEPTESTESTEPTEPTESTEPTETECLCFKTESSKVTIDSINAVCDSDSESESESLENPLETGCVPNLQPIEFLDMDRIESVNSLGIHINPTYSQDTIIKLISLIKFFGSNMTIIERNHLEEFQYHLSIKYLNQKLPVTFEFDASCQYLNVVFYNTDQTKTYLKISISLLDCPYLKYIESDGSAFLPEYQDSNIVLGKGEYLIHFAHRFINFIGHNTMRLDDDSYLIKATNPLTNPTDRVIKTKLWLYLLITKGRSWYKKFGYVPSSVSFLEYDMIIEDVRQIRLNDIYKLVTKILDANNLSDCDINLKIQLEQIKSILLPLDLDNSIRTLFTYSKSASLEEFTELTNCLTQSVFGKQYVLMFDKMTEFVVFSWHELCNKLFIANVMQINNDISNSFYALPK
jgi:hypothetical protein